MLWKDFFAKLFPPFKAFISSFSPPNYNADTMNYRKMRIRRLYKEFLHRWGNLRKKSREKPGIRTKQCWMRLHELVQNAVHVHTNYSAALSGMLNEIIAEHSKCTLHASKLIKLLWLPIMHTHSTVDMNNWITLWMRTFESFNYDWFRVMLT